MGDSQQTGGHRLQPGSIEGTWWGRGTERPGRPLFCPALLPKPGPLARGFSLPAELCDSWGSSRGGILLNPTGGGRHLLPPPSTSSCHVLGHQCFKIYWFLAGCLFRNQKHQVLNSIPIALAHTSQHTGPVQAAPRATGPQS